MAKLEKWHPQPSIKNATLQKMSSCKLTYNGLCVGCSRKMEALV